jgi:hypothetical protein
MITPERGKVYIVKHLSGLIKARFVGEHESGGYSRGPFQSRARTTTHYTFTNLATGRDIVIKSRVKIKQEVTE